MTETAQNTTGEVRYSLLALNAVDFFMADVAGGLRPFLGVYLQNRRWNPAEIERRGPLAHVAAALVQALQQALFVHDGCSLNHKGAHGFPNHRTMRNQRMNR